MSVDVKDGVEYGAEHDFDITGMFRMGDPGMTPQMTAQPNPTLHPLKRAPSSTDREMAGRHKDPEPTLLWRSMCTFEHRFSWLLQINITGHCLLHYSMIFSGSLSCDRSCCVGMSA